MRLFPRTAIAAVGIVATVFLAGCGGGGGEDGVSSMKPEGQGEESGTSDQGAGQDGARGAGADADRALRFARCMRDNGVDMPDPKIDSEGRAMLPGVPLDPDDPTMTKANKACEKYAPQPQGGKIDESALRDAMTAFASCMRDNGVDVPDPEENEDGAIVLPSENQYTAPAEKKAYDTCKGKMNPAAPKTEPR